MRFNSNGITVEQQRLQLGEWYRYCLCCGRKIKRGRYGSRCASKAEIRRNTPRIERLCKDYVKGLLIAR